MSNPLTNLNVKRIHELLEILSPAMAHELVIDDSEGVLKPKRLSLSNLAKLFIPYNNAVNDLNLGEHDITALRGLFDSLHLNTDPTSIPSDEDIGAMYYDTDALTFAVVLPNGVRAQIGEEMFVLVTRYTTAPNPILNGTPVYTVGAQGQRPTVDVARADDKNKIKVTGIATHDITNQGRITSFGLVRSVPLARKPAGETWVAGNYLWLAPTGGMTNVEPSRPTPNVRLGLITNVTSSASFDMLVYIRPAMGMYDLYDVNGDAPDNHSVLEWDSVVGYFKKTNEPVFVKVTVGELISAFQKLASHTIPGSDDDILRLQNQQVGKPHSILEIRSPDTATTEATLSLHNVASGTNDWVFDLSMHNYSGVMKLVSVLSHFTGADAGSWEWWSRYTTGTDYDMIERQLMKLDGQTGYLGIGESLSPEARVHVKQSGWVDKPAMMIVMDSSHESYPEGLYVKNDTNFASGGSLVRFKLVNVTDSATVLKLENAGTGDYINADSKFVVDKDGKITSPTIDALKGVGYTDGTLKTHEDRLDTAEGDIDDLQTLTADHETRLDSSELTLARHDQDLASVKQTLQQGNGATLDFSDIGSVALDARATGRANPTVEGLTATNIVSGAGIIAGGTVTFASVLNHKYFDVLHGMILTGTGSDIVVANDTGATKNMAVIYLTGVYGEGNEPSEADCAKIFSYFDGTKSIQLPARVRSLGNFVINGNAEIGLSNLIATSGIGITISAEAGGGFRVANTTASLNYNQVKLWQIPFDRIMTLAVSALITNNSGSGEDAVMLAVRQLDINKTQIAGTEKKLTNLMGSATFTTVPTCRYIEFATRALNASQSGTIKNVMLNGGSVPAQYRPYQDSTLYIADDSEARSIQAVYDTVSVVNGEHMLTKKISTPVSVLSGVAVNVTNYPTAKTGGKFAVELTAGGTQIGIIGTDSTSGAGMLRYELATPIITPLLTSGILQAKPKGTVYYEPYYEGSHQTNASSQITLPYEGTIDKLTGYDENLEPYEVPSTGYTLVGTTLTITGAEENEVYYVELSRSEPLAPEMSVNTLNNMVVPTIVNASTYTVLEGDHTLLINYTATGACAITIPTALILAYKRLVIKDSGGGAATKNITIGTQGTEKIDGADTYVINTAKGKVELASDGANMWVVG